MPANLHRRLHPHHQVRKLQPVGISRYCPGLFEYSQPPPGTVMLFGSLSHLVRVGTIIYALQWVMLVNKVGIRWPGVKICPLPFILAHEIIGSAGSNMSELACWYSMVYSGDTQGLKDTWELLLKQVNKNSRNIQPLRYEESSRRMLKVRDSKDVAVVLDLFGNSAYRYEQQDGNLAMP